MKKQVIKYKGGQYAVWFRRKRGARSISLRRFSSGKIVVTMPYLPGAARLAADLVAKYKHKIAKWSAKTPTDRNHYLKHKESARKIIDSRLSHYADYYGLCYNRLAIKNTASRWGSASAKNNLNFSYKVALLPEDLRDYVIVHELCHLRELNHSHRFWRLVEETIPDYKEKRKRLKSIEMHSFGKE